jgi:hypothetical protein
MPLLTERKPRYGPTVMFHRIDGDYWFIGNRSEPLASGEPDRWTTPVAENPEDTTFDPATCDVWISAQDGVSWEELAEPLP